MQTEPFPGMILPLTRSDAHDPLLPFDAATNHGGVFKVARDAETAAFLHAKKLAQVNGVHTCLAFCAARVAHTRLRRRVRGAEPGRRSAAVAGDDDAATGGRGLGLGGGREPRRGRRARRGGRDGRRHGRGRDARQSRGYVRALAGGRAAVRGRAVRSTPRGASSPTRAVAGASRNRRRTTPSGAF